MSEEDTEGQIEAVRRAIADQPDMIILAAADSDALLPLCEGDQGEGDQADPGRFRAERACGKLFCGHG